MGRVLGRGKETGAVAVYVGLILIFLLMLTSLAVDVGLLYGIRNELHNSADAAALAGASLLFDKDGNLTRDLAEAEAERVGRHNRADDFNEADTVVEIGHWSFLAQRFTASSNSVQTTWQERSFDDLDGDLDFINAVRVQANRDDAPSFFARFLGYEKFFIAADAVAFIGFAGTLYPGELDQPIAICKESITDANGAYSCNMGRMLNSGGNLATHNTGGWTNYTQQPCDTADANSLRPLICAAGNTTQVTFGQGMGATGGVQATTFSDLYDCWEAATGRTTSWNLTLPVVECPGNNVSNCTRLVGAVNLNVIWMIEQNDPQYKEVPREMQDPRLPATADPWTCDLADGLSCWKSFVDYFNLQNVTGPPLSDADYEDMYQMRNLFFLPDCSIHEPTGASGGENFGVLAKIPKLVE